MRVKTLFSGESILPRGKYPAIWSILFTDSSTWMVRHLQTDNSVHFSLVVEVGLFGESEMFDTRNLLDKIFLEILINLRY